MKDIDALVERLEKLTGPDRACDGAISLAIGRTTVFLSKHRYWNFNSFGNSRHVFSWPQSSVPAYDPETGRAVTLTETPWSGWEDTDKVPEYTASVDSALTLVPKEWLPELQSIRTDSGDQYTWTLWKPTNREGYSCGPRRNMSIALCITSLRALRALRSRTESPDHGAAEQNGKG